MIRKATAFVLLLVLGLYLPAAATSVSLCIGSMNLGSELTCCVEIPTCCDDHEVDPQSHCEDSGCCIVIPPLPDGMEPQMIEAPVPIALPAPLLLEEVFVAQPACTVLRSLPSTDASPPPPGAPIRIAFGVWRL